ncbi:hypothetical protein SAMN05442782_1627 [Streptomyces sp. OK228]|nr:hypothetical protein SAMN05442782_1627 [Streptomyces sp. OK228]
MGKRPLSPPLHVGLRPESYSRVTCRWAGRSSVLSLSEHAVAEYRTTRSRRVSLPAGRWRRPGRPPARPGLVPAAPGPPRPRPPCCVFAPSRPGGLGRTVFNNRSFAVRLSRIVSARVSPSADLGLSAPSWRHRGRLSRTPGCVNAAAMSGCVPRPAGWPKAAVITDEKGRTFATPSYGTSASSTPSRSVCAPRRTHRTPDTVPAPISPLMSPSPGQTARRQSRVCRMRPRLRTRAHLWREVPVAASRFRTSITFMSARSAMRATGSPAWYALTTTAVSFRGAR